MTDPLLITSVISGIGALIISVMTHLKYSECCGAKMLLRRSSPTTPTTTAHMSGVFRKDTLNTPSEKTPIVSTPIEIQRSF